MLAGLLEQGLAHHRAGRAGEAALFYNQILALDPRHADALHLLGLVALESGEPAKAADLIRQAATAQPQNWACWANLGQALIKMGQLDDALAALLKAEKLNRDEPQIAMGVANCLALQGRLAEAETRLRKIAQRHPDFTLAWINLGHAIRDQGRMDEAAACYRRALRIAPDSPDTHNDLGHVLHRSARVEEAEHEFRRAVALNAESAQFLCNLASVLIDRGAFAEAADTGRKAIALQPAEATGYMMVASALSHQGRLVEALEYHRKLAELEPGNTLALAAYGAALNATGHSAEGLAVLERANSREDSQLKAYIAAMKLALGDFENGWREHVQRPARRTLATECGAGVNLATALDASLSSRHVCVLREQGLGDELFFLRFARALKARGARITYRASAKIAGLLERVPEIDRVITPDEPLPVADKFLAVGDLPLALSAVEPALLPPPLALTAAAPRLTEVRERLAQLGAAPYVGLTWRGGIPPEQQSGAAWMLVKQIPLEQLGAALREVDATFLALQRNPRSGEIDEIAQAIGKPVHDLAALNEDLEAMLALLTLIDDYVGVSNTNMHLRAGAGRTARVLVPCPAEWRWMASGDESPWFPGFRIYRQAPDGDWGAPLAELARDLRAAWRAPLPDSSV